MTTTFAADSQLEVQDSYPLASLQPAMLVNHLRAPRSGVDIVQMVSELHEDVNVAGMRDAWERVSERHPALRTAFRWEDVDNPAQEVFGAALPNVTVLDWSALDSAAAESALRDFLATDRATGFDMRIPPLQRVALIEFGASNWRMVWTFHHALIDGRSFAIVLREVMALYDARESVESLPALRPIRDFAEWYAAQDFSKSEAFWRDQLKGFPAPTPLPAPVVDPSVLAAASGRGLHHRWLSRDASGKLNALAKNNGLTINNIIQGAWALLLSIHSGENDVVFGATRACRKGTIEGADDMVGLFINTVPVRARIDRNKPLIEWLGELRETWRSLFAAEHTPLRLIQRWSDVGTGSPLFNSQIVFESMPLKETMHAIEPALSKRGFQLYGGTNFPLTGLLYGGERYSLEIEHDRTVIDDATAIRLVEQLSTLLESIAATPHATVGELRALPDAERAVVVNEWNDTAVAFPDSVTLVDLLSTQATRTPHAIAAKDEVRSLTYAELDAHASRLAQHLISLGVKRDTLVAVCAERSVELVIALVAIIKAGAAYVPLDPEYPADRLAFMIEDAAAPVLIAHRRVADALPPHAAQIVWLDDVFEGNATSPIDLRAHAPRPHDLAYMIYTSGSTGRPKGALNEHRGIVNRLLWMQQEYSLGANDVVLQKTPFSFDVSVWEFFWPLISGATLVMAKPGGHRDTGYLAQTMQQHGITVCHFVPSMLRAFLADATSAQCTTLRDVMASGEALAPDLAATFTRTLPKARLHNLYGPTECAVDVSYWPCPQATTDLSVVPIGRPVANTQLYILDSNLLPVPIGVAGELFLGGVQVGRGYHNRPDLTNERFVSNPFVAGANARMYRTGDRARWRADGTVEYLGRLDFQVKIRGFRIELGEIESALLAHPAIRDVVVVAHGAGDTHRLVAYVVAEGKAPSLSALRDHLMIGLPEYMVPAIFVWLPVLPLSSNGKVDRKALPDPGIQREALSREYVAPRNERERLLADVWCKVLRLDTVGVDDNFFELGGDSLLGVQILANAAQRGLRLTLTQLLRNPTVSALAGLAENTTTTTVIHEVAGDVPLTPVQQWFFETQQKSLQHWNQALLLKVPHDLNVEALARALTAVVQQHDSFRLQFVRGSDGLYSQRVAVSVPPAVIATTDLQHVPPALRAEKLNEACEIVQSSFTIDAAPLVRAGFVQLGANEPARLIIAAHHLAIDGVSWRILLEDLESAFRQQSKGEAISLPQKTTPFSAWASRLSEPAVRAAMLQDLPYWENAGSPTALRMPRDIVDDGVSGNGVARDTDVVVVRLDAADTRALFQQVPGAYNTQINDALLAALADSFSDWLGSGEFVVNVEGHGREDVVANADVSRTTGWFTTIFPVRLALRPLSVGERLKETKELLRAAPHRGLSYGMLRYLERVEALRAQTTPEIVFNYLGQFDQVVGHSSLFEFATESTGSWYGAQTRRPHLLELNALTIGGCLELRWSFNKRVHNQDTIARVAATYAEKLRGIVAHCTTAGVGGNTPSDFPLAKLDQRAIDLIAAKIDGIEDVYPLTPMQELFIGATDPGTDPGFEQWRYRLTGPLNVTALRQAWELVTARHAMLRTAFVSEGVSAPMQVVQSSVTLPWIEHDLRANSVDAQTLQLNAILEADRQTGFAADRAPLMRLTLVRLSEQEYELVWSNHHLLLDRWSWPLILQEIQQIYPALARGAQPDLPGAPTFSRFVAWQRNQSPSEAREFWSRHFAEFNPPPRLVMSRADASESDASEVVVAFGDADTAALHAFARAHQLAPNAVIEAAWALCLARRSNHHDVSFGVAVSGRDAAVAGIERLVGLTMNNLPLRARVPSGIHALEWLASVHDAQTELQQYAFVPLASIQEWSQVPWRTRLFETLLVFQHDDAETRTGAWLGAGLKTTLVHVPTRTAYPLSMIVAGRDALEFRATFDARYFDEASALALTHCLAAALRLLIADNNTVVSELLGALPDISVANSTTSSARPYTAPRNATESVLARIWGEVFDVDRVGVLDNFFMLGGYSLVATQIISRIRNTLKVDAPVRLLFQHPTVAELATALAARDRKPGQVERIAQVVERVQGLSLDELRRANAARATNI